jgi:HK97 family phage major capsid protein
MIIDQTQIAAIRKNAPTFTQSLRKAGVDLDHIQPHALSWQDLNRIERDARAAAKPLPEKITDGLADNRATEIEAAFDGLTEIADALAADKDLRTQRGDRGPHAGVDLSRRPLGQAGSTACGDFGHDHDEPAAWALRAGQPMRAWAAARSDGDLRGLSIGQFLRAAVVGAETDVERRALAAGSDSAGGFTVPLILSAALIDALRAESVVVQAGAQTVPLEGKTAVAKLLTDPVPAWRAENAAVNESDPTFGQVVFDPKSLAVLTKVSFELMDDSVNVGTELPRIMAAALAKELDRVALLGSGTAPEPRGVANLAGVSTEALNGALTNYAPLLRGRTALLGADVGEPTAIIMHPRDEGTLSGLVDTTGQPLIAPARLADTQMLTTTQIPVDGGAGDDEASIIIGDFTRLLIGMRQEIRVEILKERYADQLQYGLICHMRADVVAEHAKAFHVITGVQG